MNKNIPKTSHDYDDDMIIIYIMNIWSVVIINVDVISLLYPLKIMFASFVFMLIPLLLSQFWLQTSSL